MKRTRLFVLVEGYLERALSADERRELESAVHGDPELRRAFVAEVRLARRLRAVMRAVMFATVGWSAMQRFPCGCRNGRLGM